MPNRLVAAIKADRSIIIVAVLCGGFFLSLLASKGISGLRPGSIINNSILYFLVCVIFVSFRTLKLMFFDRPEKLFLAIWENEATEERVANVIRAIPVLVLLCAFMPIFSAMKSSIPLFNQFQWDQTFIEWDRSIFGQDAWRVFYPLLFQPIFLAAIAFLYHLWILLIYVGGLFFAFKQNNPDLRKRYFITYFLIWTLVGGVMAIYFSSVGPCFVQPLLGINEFEPLMAELQKANSKFPIMVLDVQNELILWQRHGESGLGRGITAMPSMHVSLALLFFLAVRQISLVAKWVFGLFFCIICVGSIVTGYHYAVDGIVAAAATLVIWTAVGFALKLKSPATGLTPKVA